MTISLAHTGYGHAVVLFNFNQIQQDTVKFEWRRKGESENFIIHNIGSDIMK